MVNYFILVASDVGDEDGWEAVTAHEIALERLREGRWPIYPRTRNRSAICEGDQCLIYIGGKGANGQTIIGAATVGELSKQNTWQEPSSDRRLEAVSCTLRLADQHIFTAPVSVRPVLSKLSFVTNVATWGGAFQGGCRRIKKEDFELLSEI